MQRRKEPNPSAPPGSRRKEYAEATRQAIIAAAREMFGKQGYFSAKVDDIAAMARVAPATVYAVSGGKLGMLRALMDLWMTAPEIESAVRRVEELRDSEAILQLCASTCCAMAQKYGDIIRIALNTAPHDSAVAKSVATATGRYRKALTQMARRLVALGDLRKSVDLDQAADVLWFYFGYSGVFALVEENGWTYDRAEKWLGNEAVRALLRKS